VAEMAEKKKCREKRASTLKDYILNK